MDTFCLACTVAALLCIPGCSSKPLAEVSRSELAAVRQSYSDIKPGTPHQEVLDSFKSGNKVKLASSAIDGAVIEEWKYEAFHDEKNRKDLFVAFMYFYDDRFVDGSDTRIDFRNNPELISRWSNQAGK